LQLIARQRIHVRLYLGTLLLELGIAQHSAEGLAISALK
jgi:hypothetical protein